MPLVAGFLEMFAGVPYNRETNMFALIYKQAGNWLSPEVQLIFYRFIIYTVYVRFEAY